jgi:integrase
MPAGGWALLRGLAAERKLKAVDETTVAAWNTTVTTYLVSARSIFGDKSRAKVLRDLLLPDLGDFMAALPVDLPCPEGHQEIPVAVMAEVERRLPGLMDADAQLYAFFLACEETGVRPGTLRVLDAAALRVLSAEEMGFWKARMAVDWKLPESELCDFGGLLDIPAKKGGNAVRTPVSSELAGLLVGMRVPGSLFGCKHKTAAGELHERLNGWLRECGVEGNHVTYLLRHRKAQALRRFGGKSAVAVGLGHTSEAMAERYSREDRIVPAVFSRAG